MSDLGAIAIVRLDKERGITSHDTVDRLRRIVGTRRVGHAGTLDPFATGLLLLAWGRATRLLPFLSGAAKTYEATLMLGVSTDTFDMTGRVLARTDRTVDEDAVRAAGRAFVGPIAQRAPAVSAIKQGGEPLHRRVRRGEPVEPPVRQVVVDSLAIERVDLEARTVTFKIACSSGTYIRSLAHDWGQALGVGAALATLRRTAIGPHAVAGAIPTLDLLDRPVGSIPDWNDRLATAGLTPEAALAFLPALPLDEAEALLLADGRAPAVRRALEAGHPAGTAALRLTDAAGRLLAVGALPAEAAEAREAPIELRLVWAAGLRAEAGETLA